MDTILLLFDKYTINIELDAVLYNIYYIIINSLIIEQKKIDIYLHKNNINNFNIEIFNNLNIIYYSNYNNIILNKYKYIIKLPINPYINYDVNIVSLINTYIITNSKYEYFILPQKYYIYFNKFINNDEIDISELNIKFINNFYTNQKIYIKHNISNEKHLKLVYKSVSFGNNFIHNMNYNKYLYQYYFTKHYIDKICNFYLNPENKDFNNYMNINSISIELSKLKINTCEYLDIHNIFYSNNLKKSKKIAICIYGQVRTFIYPNVFNSLKKQLDKFDNNNIDYHIFFLMENKKTYTWQDIDKKTFLYNIDKKYIINIINNITSKYTIDFYNFNDIINEIPIYNHRQESHVFQTYMFHKMYTNYVIPYENINNIRFDYIIKTRPDIKYTNNNIADLLYKVDDIILYHDIIFIIARNYCFSITIIYLFQLFKSLTLKLTNIVYNNSNLELNELMTNNKKHLYKLLTTYDNILDLEGHRFFHFFFYIINKNVCLLIGDKRIGFVDRGI